MHGFIIFALLFTSPGPNFTREDCLLCHEDVKIEAPTHKGMECTDCHKGIKELPHKVPLSRVNCGLCHSGVMGSFKEDPHARARRQGNLKAPGCTDCHGTHNIYPVYKKRSRLHPSNLDAFCSTCHSNVKAPKVYHAAQYPSEKCLECHGVKGGKAPYVDIGVINGSVHRNLECTDCHRRIKNLRHTSKEEVGPVLCEDCGICHKNECAEHSKSVHGRAIKEHNIPAARCMDCHGSHDIYHTFDTLSHVNYVNLPKTCGKCHGVPELAEKYGIPIKNPYALYEQSVHHQLVLQGIRAAVCSDCHGIHNIEPHTVATSPINKGNVPITCSHCHEREYEDFAESEHWRAYRMGVTDAPVCTDCHSEHRILPPNNPNSPVYPLNVPKTCTDCHERVKLTESYGIPAMKLSTYLSSYHGLAIKAGNINAANCASCHGYHSILSSNDPRSPIYRDNLPKTCGKCHPGIASGRDIGPVHQVVNQKKELATEIVKRVYAFLILFLIGGMIVYCLLDFFKKSRERRPFGYMHIEEIVDNVRFNSIERTLHLIHLISFFVLVYTGFAHHYPDSILFSFFVRINGGHVRALIHRAAGTLITVVFLLHLFLLAFTRRGRRQFVGLLPRLKDFKDAYQLLLFNLGLRKNRPALSLPFTFYEKLEYWALIWGTVIMAVTGVALWFTGASLSLVPKWILDVMLLIHFYEAILASLAILVWHLYWTVFDPMVYPYNPAMFSRKIPSYLVEVEKT